MITFVISLVLLVLGYAVYSRVLEKIVSVKTSRKTPATTMADGIDYVPMKRWKTFLIQFLNIAGVGPICGAIMGAQFGASSFLWIVFGSIFAGGVHDYMSGYISLRWRGNSLPEIHGRYLGKKVKALMRFFTVILMLLVGAVFINTPATLLMNFTPDWNILIWIGVIFAYYLVATLLPIDKLIGRIYPVFGMLLLGMAVAIVVAFIIYKPDVPEIWNGLQNRHPHADTNPIFPMMFVSIACGAISGFHATQSPLMARCMTNEKEARPVFYGAMITEGIVALIWAAAATVFYHDPMLQQLTISPDGQPLGGNAMVGVIANTWFTPVIATVTILGVISAAITSGDTALRSARLIVSDIFHFNQKPIMNRLLVAVPIFAITAGILVFSLSDKEGFDIIWRYFAWCNQILAMVTLWALTIFLHENNRNYVVTIIPALFMTMVCSTFILIAPNGGGLGLSPLVSYIGGGCFTLLTYTMFRLWIRKRRKDRERVEAKKRYAKQ